MKKYLLRPLPIKIIKLAGNREGWESEKTGLSEDKRLSSLKTKVGPQ